MEIIEGIQRRATKQLPGTGNLIYPERLKALNLPTLRYRRVSADMLEICKIINGYYEEEVCNFIHLRTDNTEEQRARGHSKKLYPRVANTTRRKESFSFKTVKIWNSLPEGIVSAEKINI